MPLASLNAQCDLIVLGQEISSCDDNGTPSDPSDDTYEVTVRVFNNATDEYFENDFGPYLCSAGNQNETLIDPNNTSCTTPYTIIAPTSCAAPTCPTYDLDIVGIYEDDGCEMFAIVGVTGFNSADDVSLVNFKFDIDGATITGIDVADQDDPVKSELTFSTTGSSASVYFFSQSSPLIGSEINNYNPLQKFRIDITGDPGECFELELSSISGVQVINTDNQITASCDPTDYPNAVACIPSTTVAGSVTGFSQAWTPCYGTQNLGIIGAEISITGDNGSCQDFTGTGGDYSCDLCPSDEYEICVETECDEPCGLTDLDLVIFRDYLLGNITIPGPEFVLTGDVNGDGSASTADIGCLQNQLTYGVTSCIDNWCRFVPVEEYNDLNLTNNGQSLNMSVDNCITFTNNEIVNQLVSTDFIRFNIGDFNGSCDDCVHGEGGPYLLQGDVPLALRKVDNSWKVALKQDFELLAFTGKIELGPGITSEMVEIQSTLPGMSYSVDEGVLHMIWVEMNDTEVLFVANATEPFITITISGDIEVDPSLISDDNYILDIQKGIFKLIEGETEVEFQTFESDPKRQKVRLNHFPLQNVPIMSNEVNVQFFDMSGRKVMESHHQLYEGINHLVTDKFVLSTGIYIVRYVTDQCIFSQKVFIE